MSLQVTTFHPTLHSTLSPLQSQLPGALHASGSSPLFSIHHDMHITLMCKYKAPNSKESIVKRLHFLVPLHFSEVDPVVSPSWSPSLPIFKLTLCIASASPGWSLIVSLLIPNFSIPMVIARLITHYLSTHLPHILLQLPAILRLPCTLCPKGSSCSLSWMINTI